MNTTETKYLRDIFQKKLLMKYFQEIFSWPQPHLFYGPFHSWRIPFLYFNEISLSSRSHWVLKSGIPQNLYRGWDRIITEASPHQIGNHIGMLKRKKTAYLVYRPVDSTTKHGVKCNLHSQLLRSFRLNFNVILALILLPYLLSRNQ